VPTDPYADWQLVPSQNVLFAHPPTAFLPDNNSVHLLAVGGDSQLYHTSTNWQLDAPPDLNWADWRAVAQGVLGTPAVVTAVDETQDVFIVGVESTVQHLSFTRGAWKPQPAIAMQVHPDVTAATTGPGKVTIFGRGLDNQLTYVRGTLNQWDPSHSCSGVIVSSPSVVTWADTMFQAVALGPSSDALYQYFDESYGWSGWQSFGGELTSAPVIATLGPDGLYIFARGGDLALQQRYWDGKSWGNRFSTLGGKLVAGPAVAADPIDGRIEVVATQLDDHTAGSVYWDGGWGTMVGNGGQFNASPVPVILRDLHQLFMAGLGANGKIYARRLDFQPGRG
jgi:hypothetical protein